MITTAKIFFIFIVICQSAVAQDYRTTDDRHAYILTKLNLDISELKIANDLYHQGDRSRSIDILTDYFANTLSERFFFNWHSFKERLTEYSSISKSQIKNHKRRSSEMMQLYVADNDWNLPMKSKEDKNLSAYEFRHLARQHKAVDVMFTYFYEEENTEHLNYLMGMVNSLEEAYIRNSYEEKGNGVFESFRAGYRVYNWLFVFNALCSSPKFNAEQKFQFLKAFYYHAIELEEATKKFRFGNHHTKGLVALALISILFPEFEESKQWFNQSISLLTEHLTKEINPDGFQLERSIHYHIGDIDNYFYVYYLAKINNLQLPPEFESRLFKMFEALTKLAYPNKTLPVLQDDTDNPWAEFNNMKNIMSLGYVLFENPSFRYFSSDQVSSGKYWFVNQSDKDKLKVGRGEKPTYLSTSLPETGYYTMRNGWRKDDIVVTISAGLSDRKPDHQHGDMLGIQLYANENYMLPNYQVRYYLDEYQHFKNSFVKNICIVDSIPQGGDWKGNSGGSGFGKFLSLPDPAVENFYTSSIVDVFIGKINYTNTEHRRKVVFIKDGFILVKDNLQSDEFKSFQQIWQGNYSREEESHFRSTFSNGSGLDIIQMHDFRNVDYSTSSRGKNSIVFNSPESPTYEFLTLLHPFSEFDTRIDERYKLTENTIASWGYKTGELIKDDLKVNAKNIFYNDQTIVSFATSFINSESFGGTKPDVLIDLKGQVLIILESKRTIDKKKQNEFIPFVKYKLPGI